MRPEHPQLNSSLLPVSVTSAMEFVCLLFFTVDLFLRYRHRGHKFFWNHRPTVLRSCFVAFTVLNLSLHLLVPHIPRVHRIARPVMLGTHFRNVSKILTNMIATVPKVAYVTVLLSFFIVFFGVFGHILFGGQSATSCTTTTDAASDAMWWNGHQHLLCSPFSKQCTNYFGTLGGSLNQMFILLTTANYPDIMMPAYNCSAWSAIFFIVFLVIGLYFVFNLILAVSYATFQEKTKSKVLSVVTHRLEALDLAFTLLVEPLGQDRVVDVASVGPSTAPAVPGALSPSHSVPMLPGAGKARQISVSSTVQTLRPPSVGAAGSVQSMPRAMRDEPEVPTPSEVELSGATSSASSSVGHRDGQADGAFGGVRGGTGIQHRGGQTAVVLSSDWQGRPPSPLLEGASAHLMPSGTALQRQGSTIERVMQFDLFSLLLQRLRPELQALQRRILFDCLDGDNSGCITRSQFRKLPQYVEIKFKERLDRSIIDPNAGWWATLRVRVRNLVAHKYFQACADMLVYINGMLVVARYSDGVSVEARAPLSTTLQCILWVFAVELLVKLLGLGWKEFLEDGFNVLDLLVIPPAVVVQAVLLLFPSDSSVRWLEKLAFLRVLRVLRALRALRGFGVIVRTFWTIVPMFLRYLLSMLLVYYAWSIMGMESFAGTIQFSASEQPPFFHELDPRLNGTAYYTNAYWNNNFNGLGRSLVTLFELMVVNNWAIIMMGYAYSTHMAAMIYFYAWFFVMVIVVLNIVTAFLLDDFTVMQNTLTAEEDSGKQYAWKETALAAAAANDPNHARKWKLSRTTHPIHVYERMFEEEVRQYLADMEARQFADANVLNEIVRHSFSAKRGRRRGGSASSGGVFAGWGRRSGSSRDSSARGSPAGKAQPALGMRGRSLSHGEEGDGGSVGSQGASVSASVADQRSRANTDANDAAGSSSGLSLQRQDFAVSEQGIAALGGVVPPPGGFGAGMSTIREAAVRRATRLGVELDPSLLNLHTEVSGELKELKQALLREGSLLDQGIADDLLRVVVGQDSTDEQLNDA